MNNITLISIAILMVFTTMSCKDSVTGTEPEFSERQQNWIDDIEMVKKTFREKQFNYQSITNPDLFEAKLDAVKNRISSQSDFDIMLDISKVTAELNIAHNRIIPTSTYDFYPFIFEEIQGKLYLTKTIAEYQNLLSKHLTHIQDIPISVVMDSLRKIIPYENEYGFQKSFAVLVCSRDILQYFGIPKNGGNYTFRFNNDSDQTDWNVTPNPIQSNFQNFGSQSVFISAAGATPLYLKNRNKFYWFEYLAASGTLYFKYNRCANDPDYSFSAFADDLKTFILNNDVQKFVMDFRGNQGGNSSVIAPMEFILETDLNQKDRLFLITDRHTFSSAIINAIEFNQYSNGTLLGEPPGGSPNHYGEAELTILPRSKLYLFTTKKFFAFTGCENVDMLPLDEFIPQTSVKYFAGIDPVMEYIESK